ncbi:hypothetical protein C0585_08255 [Candidatus Woesearchaeota archaeon]|nr:MAG: hypothetical protein C0585_08255 [Candidatus Woesearchaeota archaeon]
MAGTAPTYSVGWKKNSSMGISLAGCDFNCPNCDKTEIKEFKEDFLTNILDIKREITYHSSNIDSVFFFGAEPCLQRQALLSLARHAKTAGLKIGLKTNGTNPHTIKSLLNEKLLDFLELKIQTNFDEEIFEKATKSKNFFKPTDSIIQSVYETFNTLKFHGKHIDIGVRTIIVPEINDDIEILKEIGEKIKSLTNTWILEANENLNDEKLNEFSILLEDFFPNMFIETHKSLSSSE